MSSDGPNHPVEILTEDRVALVNETARVPDDWAGRALYTGETGARNWLDVVREPAYPLRDPNYFNLGPNRLAAVQARPFATFVSLGPGDALNELSLIQTLNGPGPARLSYIPVDISLPLLREAIANVRPYANVPLGILCDFEDGRDFLAEALRRRARLPMLIAMLGGTVGNLDHGEQRFFAWVRALLEAGDAFLLDLPLAGPGWAPADEPRLKHQAYTGAFRRFLAEGMDRGDPAGTAAAFEQRVQLSLSRDVGTGAELITVSDRGAGRTLLTFRRYRWEPMLGWFGSQGFVVEFARSSIASDQDKFGMGVVLLAARR